MRRPDRPSEGPRPLGPVGSAQQPGCSRAHRRPSRSRQCSCHVRPELDWRQLCRSGFEPDQVGPPGQTVGLRPDHRPGATPERVPYHRAAATATNCISYLGKHAGSTHVGRDEGHPDRPAGPPGARPLQLREGTAAGDSSDPPSRHVTPSDGETVAPLEPPRLQDGPPRPRGHALAEPVRAGPFPGVGLVSALHVIQPFATPERHPGPVRRRVVPGPRVRDRPAAASPPMLGAFCRTALVASAATVYVHPIPAPRVDPNVVAGRRGGRRGVRLKQ